MRVLKIFLALVCLGFVARFIADLHGTRTSQMGSLYAGHSPFVMILSLAIALLCAVEFYGIHKRASFAWTLGWVMLVATFVGVLFGAGSSALKVPKTDDPWIAFAATMVGGSLVALYWALWWKRQKPYFTADAPSVQGTGKKELVVVVCISALAFAGLTLFSSRTAKYQALATPAVKQFHEEIEAGQYITIYNTADDTLRGTTSESDFVNLLQSVHQKLGDFQNSKLSSTRIAWHGKQSVTISLNYDTKFARGTATERFVWQDRDGRVTLARYEIKSEALPER